MNPKLKLPYPIILASASPRRAGLLRDAGYDFSIEAARIAEPVVPEIGAKHAAVWAETLAYLKARTVSMDHPDTIVIGADTVVTHGDTIIGKPADEADARRILSTLFGGDNEVITGLALLCPALNKTIITHETTTLVMRAMNPREVDDYIASGAWRDKAGAYALQEGGDKFLQSISGSESNVVGLPLEKLNRILSDFST
ncbi:MAG: septum formation protein Maf [Sedimentisphaerales bacterium]|nr:septum formation protein Maf [Sedimentisphaerales bacterium]